MFVPDPGQSSKTLCRVFEVSVGLTSLARFGEVAGGHLGMQCHLIAIETRPQVSQFISMRIDQTENESFLSLNIG